MPELSWPLTEEVYLRVLFNRLCEGLLEVKKPNIIQEVKR